MNDDSRSPGPADAVLDRAAALDLAGGDPDLLREVLQMTQDGCAEGLAAIRAASAAAEVQQLRQAAHRLKGTLVAVAAGPAGEAAAAVELAARGGDLDAARAAIAVLEREVVRLQPVLQSLISS